MHLIIIPIHFIMDGITMGTTMELGILTTIGTVIIIIIGTPLGTVIIITIYTVIIIIIGTPLGTVIIIIITIGTPLTFFTTTFTGTTGILGVTTTPMQTNLAKFQRTTTTIVSLRLSLKGTATTVITIGTNPILVHQSTGLRV
jgi:hypothetical protein